MTESRLSTATLSRLPSTVEKPIYDRSRVKTGIVHLGVGNFHRAHQAVYCDDVLSGGDLDWGITGLSLRSTRMRSLLQPQNGLYTLCVQNGGEPSIRVIGAIHDIVCAVEEPTFALSCLTDEATRIVSLTITEKGYALPVADQQLCTEDDFPKQEPHALVFLVEALLQRYERDIPFFTILSCDNLPSNGKTLKARIETLAATKNEAFAAAVRDRLCCPSTMVDRIVPQTTEHDVIHVESVLGLMDAAPVFTEPFCQWIIEDDFSMGRPDWDLYGAQFVQDVRPFEDMKLRLLNGAHTFIALFGQLIGVKTVAEVMRLPHISSFLDLFWDQAVLTLNVDRDTNPYRDELKQRFGNAALQHQTAQIATDTSQKMPQRIGAPLSWLADSGGGTRPHSFVVALWIRCLSGKDEKANVLAINDPLAERLRRAAASANVVRLLKASGAFDEDLILNSQVVLEIASQVADIRQNGAQVALTSLLRDCERMVPS